MGSNSTYAPQHANVWSIISEDEAARSQNGHVGQHIRTDLMSGFKSEGPNR